MTRQPPSLNERRFHSSSEIREEIEATEDKAVDFIKLVLIPLSF